jgi:hypothetical protein
MAERAQLREVAAEEERDRPIGHDTQFRERSGSWEPAT